MAEKDLAATLNDTRPQLWARLRTFNKPLIAAVSGYALGAGANWHCCAMWWLPERTRVWFAGNHSRHHAGAGGTQRLIRSVGKSLASKMVLSGESITARKSKHSRPGWLATSSSDLTSNTPYG
ncbi:enoyl-CoA hydratase-related protein [Escherichia coli]|uniref:enoyl-CoA hydratase-related protein n=1 Tax=Escherichia coli TaxID=562 RepID=UPI002148ACF9|nr:enoyl-CoA hydratase-related protein [Escherichia coli]MCR1051285.1 enoyl-CoA hydratase-related protein [Escherichia coli]